MSRLASGGMPAAGAASRRTADTLGAGAEAALALRVAVTSGAGGETLGADAAPAPGT
ncbi:MULTISPECIES: hypothetical protein [Rhizobium]|uniref:hypothetical protein n=1 Tax=Rhizobium TaxID=379 RepID=UPI00163DC22A|nr:MULTISPECIES: hypothetical protein [Rhizobium]